MARRQWTLCHAGDVRGRRGGRPCFRSLARPAAVVGRCGAEFGGPAGCISNCPELDRDAARSRAIPAGGYAGATGCRHHQAAATALGLGVRGCLQSSGLCSAHRAHRATRRHFANAAAVLGHRDADGSGDFAARPPGQRLRRHGLLGRRTVRGNWWKFAAGRDKPGRSSEFTNRGKVGLPTEAAKR